MTQNFLVKKTAMGWAVRSENVVNMDHEYDGRLVDEIDHVSRRPLVVQTELKFDKVLSSED